MTHFVKYLGIGGISTLIQFLLLTLLVKYQLTSEITVSTETSIMSSFFKPLNLKIAAEVIASAFAYFLSSIFNYFANYHFTFASKSSHTETLPKFAAAVGIGLGVNTLLFAIFLHCLNTIFLHQYASGNYNYLVAQCLATGITVFLNFLVHKLWIYKGH